MRRVLALLVASIVGLGLLAGPAGAQGDGDRALDLTVDLTLGDDGSFTVRETWVIDFVGRNRGIFRTIPVTLDIAPGGFVDVPDGDVDDWMQLVRISDFNVRTSVGAPDDTDVTRPGRHEVPGEMLVRVGDPEIYISGTHTYEFTYRVDGALLEVDPQTTLLYWNAVGTQWELPIDHVRVEVHAAAGETIISTECAVGFDVFSSACDLAEGGGSDAVAQAEGLQPFVPMTVRVAVPSDAHPASDPLLRRRFNFLDALWGDGRAIPAALLATLLLGYGVGRLFFREGRDREARGDVTIDHRTDTTHRQDLEAGTTRRLFEPRVVPVEFRPPEGLRPGQLGLIVDERVDPVDITASIVDLAVRGHLVIEEEVNKTLWWSKTDWKLIATDADRHDLLAYEQRLLSGLFGGGQSILVSELKGTFSTDYKAVEVSLYEDGRKQGWFARRPDKVRDAWLGIGVVTLVLALVAFGFAIYWARAAIVALPFVLAGLALTIGHRWMPRRTPKGSALLNQTLGFREFIETAETDRAQFAEREHLFVEYLPYAVVFGATEKWARAFADLGVLGAAGGSGLGGWYIWHGSGAFDARSFSAGLGDFSSNLGAAVVTAPPSSGGGFGGGGGFSGGGGFGGGGGGSW